MAPECLGTKRIQIEHCKRTDGNIGPNSKEEETRNTQLKMYPEVSQSCCSVLLFVEHSLHKVAAPPRQSVWWLGCWYANKGQTSGTKLSLESFTSEECRMDYNNQTGGVVDLGGETDWVRSSTLCLTMPGFGVWGLGFGVWGL